MRCWPVVPSCNGLLRLPALDACYEQVGAMHPRPERGLLSRPTVDEVYHYRARIDAQMLELLETVAGQAAETTRRLEIGLQHEQQHQELLLTDLQYNLSVNPLRPAVYMPVDISGEHLRDSASHIARDYPELQVEAVCADYSSGLQLPDLPQQTTRAAFFPGSSIGNFEPPAAVDLLREVGRDLGPGGAMLIGVDLKKDRHTLDAAYNDSRQITAAFNLNLLTRINREANADFDTGRFDHRAFYNEAQGRVEMHLVSTCEQQVCVDGHHFCFGAGEHIHTENSYKYSVQEFHALGAAAGYEAEQVWTDPDELFSVHCLRVSA